MTISGLLPATVRFLPYTDNMAGGAVEYFSGTGVRTNVSTAANGDDIWSGTATTLPVPPQPGGQQMTVVSTSANDAAAGTGIRTVEIHYLDNTGAEQTETITLNGVAGVNTVATNIRFVNEFYAESVGTGGGAAGTITIYALGAPATIYTQINPGHFKHSNTARMVPLGKVLLIESFTASGGAAAGGKSAQLNLRSTSHHGLPLPISPNTVWGKGAIILVFNSAETIDFYTPIQVPELCMVKVTSFTSAAGADVAANWYGKLVAAPV